MHRAFPLLKCNIRRLAVQGGRLLLCTVSLYSAAIITLAHLGYAVATVTSDSMFPTTQKGDLVLLAQRRYQPGDVVMFRQRGRHVLHRLVSQTVDKHWRTKGDANVGVDPWIVAARDIEGVAVGKIRNFGLPLLLWESVVAAFTSSKTLSSRAASTYWQQSSMSWVVYRNATSITTSNPNYVTLLGSGDRKIWIQKMMPYHIHFFGRLSNSDTAQPGYHFVLSACVNTNDDISCGLVVQFNDSTKVVSLRVVNSSGIVATLASGIFTESLSTNQHIAIYRTSNNVLVQLNGAVVLAIDDLAAAARKVNASFNSGSHVGLWLRGQNQVTSARLNIW